jgi:hypothetical protein
MASFEIPDGPTTIKLGSGTPGAQRTGTAQFTVNNTSESTMNAQLSLAVQGNAKPEWFSIDGESERKLISSKSETVNVKVAVPSTAAAGTYPFRLRVAAVNDPDNDFVDGPTTVAEVEQAAEPVIKKNSPWWWWLVGALVLLGIVGGIVWGLTREKAPAVSPQAGNSWFGGQWTGTIDGRAAAMRWWNEGSERSPRYVGEFSDGNSGRYVPLTYVSHTATQFNFRHQDGNTWQLTKVGEGQAKGFTTWQGMQFPLVMIRTSTTVPR